MRQPLAVVMAWPAQDVELLQAFLERESPPEERVELMLAQLLALEFNRGRAKDTPAREVKDFLLPDPWATPGPLAADEQRMRGVLNRNAGR